MRVKRQREIAAGRTRKPRMPSEAGWSRSRIAADRELEIEGIA